MLEHPMISRAGWEKPDDENFYSEVLGRPVAVYGLENRTDLKIEIIETAVNSLSGEQLVEIHNELCLGFWNAKDDVLYDIDLFDELLDGLTPTSIFHTLSGDIRLSDDLLYYDGYGHLHSATYSRVQAERDNCVHKSDIADGIFDYWERMYTLPDDLVADLEALYEMGD